jgi:hypothetical protein
MSQAVVCDSTIESAEGDCFRIEDNAGGSIKNTVLKGKVGGEVQGSGQLEMSSANVQCAETGITCGGIGQAIVRDSTIESAERDCVRFSGNAGGRIENTVLKGKVGVGVQGSGQLEMSSANIQCAETGIICEDVSQIIVRDSAVESGEGDCVRFASNAVGRIEKTTLQGRKGIEVKGSGQLAIAAANIRCAETGITCDEIGQITIHDSTIESVNAVCVKFLNNAGGSIEKTVLKGKDAVQCAGLAEVTLTDTRMEDVDRGIFCMDEAQIEMSASSVRCAGIGVTSEGISRVIVRDSFIESTDGACAKFFSNAGGRVEGTALKGRVGVEVQGSGQVILRDNTLTVTLLGVRYCQQSSEGQFLFCM